MRMQAKLQLRAALPKIRLQLRVQSQQDCPCQEVVKQQMSVEKGVLAKK